MVKHQYPATCNKCGKQIKIAIPMSEDSTFICDGCKGQGEMIHGRK